MLVARTVFFANEQAAVSIALVNSADQHRRSISFMVQIALTVAIRPDRERTRLSRLRLQLLQRRMDLENYLFKVIELVYVFVLSGKNRGCYIAAEFVGY